MPDPTPQAGTFFLPRPVLIDLTGSDDENNGPEFSFSRQQRQPEHHPAFLPGNIPISNHGLILPGTFFDLTNVSNGNNGFCHAQTAHGVGGTVPSRFTAPGSSQVRPAQNQSFRTYANGSSTNRRSTRNRIVRPGDRPQFSNASSALNPAKRRKTDGATIQHSNTVYPPILPPQYHNRQLRPAMGSFQSIPAAIIPQFNGAQRVEQRPAPSPYQSSPLSTPQNTDVVAAEREKKLHDVAGKRVLQHIRTALQKYRKNLPKHELIKIVRDTANKLCSPNVYEKFKANTWTVEYDQELLRRAQTYVDDFANALLAKLAETSQGANGSSDQLVGSEDAASEIQQPTRRIINGHDRARSSSDETTEDDHIFERYPRPRRENPVILPPQVQRHYSSSPTTSYSTDLPDSVSLAERRRLEDTSTASPTPECASRAQASQLPKRSKPVSRDVKDRLIDRSRNSNESHFSNIPYLNSSRQIQASRLSALDPSLERPYLNHVARDEVQRGLEVARSSRQGHFSSAEMRTLEGMIVHVDFCLAEIEFVKQIIRTVVKDGSPLITSLMKGQEPNVEHFTALTHRAVQNPKNDVERAIKIRSKDGIRAFLEDAAAGKLSANPSFLKIESSVSVSPCPRQRISTLLSRREIWGMDPAGVRENHLSFKEEFCNHLEDSLVRKSEWTDCCGDISSFSWTSDRAFICGATAHSDNYNMQYNKPGNLLVGSASLDTLRSIADHRIPRPFVGSSENAENALESMRQTQDPWIYTSVVSMAHNDLNGFTFTASFDRTVKVWEVAEDGSFMNLRGTWDHDGKVNFVVTSEWHEKVATASDVSSSAIRVYNLDQVDIDGSPYDTYDCDKSHAQAQEPHTREKWAYFPATIAWAKAHFIQNYLLVGYSPRSLTGDEADIPEERRNSGELCLWDVDDGERIQISSARTQNVFEVLWHPNQPVFLAATSPAGLYDSKTRTQIRIFASGDQNTFSNIKTLDCAASDINELTIMPYSELQMYVTASCTDGKAYVWDTAQGDRPIHVLGHGESLDNPIHDIPREDADTGVKFTAWGKTLSRLYTGSSDGKVYAWNIENSRGNSFVRTVLKVSGGISAGAFSKDYSRLVIGDATGKVHLLEINDEGLEQDAEPVLKHPGRKSQPGFAAKLPGGCTTKAPKVIIPHPEPPPPVEYERRLDVEQSARDIARTFLEEGQLTLHPSRLIGAIQGPNYCETLFYRFEAHIDNDGTKSLLPDWQAKQQFETRSKVSGPVAPRLPVITKSSDADHLKNVRMDFDFSRLSLETQQELQRDRVDFGFDNEHTFDFEMSPRKRIFRVPKIIPQRISFNSTIVD